ncbi:DUF1800 domain-containing protein [Hypericibacter sp.]|uniref:DUF1800 domain-containing protein n=1 Tax=Hypericibacter sp. TaxID=2705401 RepID=UPI003D6CAE84
MATTLGFHAVARFGLGARSGEIEAASADPRGWVLAQLGDRAAPSALSDMPTGQSLAAELVRALNRGPESLQQTIKGAAREQFIAEIGARARLQIETAAPFYERLVAFWSNHFTVSIAKPAVLGLAGAFEREAIRPHVTGKFADLLLAVLRHPAMLIYLDNAQSVGPHSRAGLNGKHGINENLGREVLELHTLGVDGGYGQADVEAFARMLTGWSIGGKRGGIVGAFNFYPQLHEPGAKILLGKTYAEGGEDEVERAVEDLARHPATAHHLALKFTRHFVADDPAEDLVERVAHRYLDSDGDLGALASFVVMQPEAWAQPLAKIKTPNELMISGLRALGRTPEPKAVAGSLKAMGQIPFNAPSPAGWPDRAEGWVGPEALLQRADWAMAVAQRIPQGPRPVQLLDLALGPAASATTRQAIERAPSPADGFALVLAAPEFQRR